MKYASLYTINVRYLMDLFRTYGYEIYLIGGCVRDYMLGIPPKDYDFCTNATPNEIIEICKQENIEYHDVGIRYGTVQIRIHDEYFEVTTYRLDSTYSDGRRPDSVKFSNRLLDDVERRDFTINAVAMDDTETTVDLFDGINDLNNRIVRCVGNPKQRFLEDGLRILRAVRFAIKYGFIVEEDTLQAMKDNVQVLSNVSMERIYNELNMIMHLPNTYRLYDEFVTITNYVCRLCGVKLYDSHAHYGYAYKLKDDNSCNSHVGKWFVFTFKCNINEINRLCNKLKVPNGLRSVLTQLYELIINVNLLYCDKFKLKQYMNAYGANLVLYAIQFNIMTSSLYDTINYHHTLDMFNEIVNDNEPYMLGDLYIDGNDVVDLGVSGEDVGTVLNNILRDVMMYPIYNSRTLQLALAAKYTNEIKKG